MTFFKQGLEFIDVINILFLLEKRFSI